MEQDSDRVLEGQIVHEGSYGYLKEKEVMIDQAFKIDAVDGDYVREVKLTSKMAAADRLQMLFYLYQLYLRGISKIGLLSYPKEKRTEEVVFDDNSEEEIKEAIAETYQMIARPTPPKKLSVDYCRPCAYYAFCYAEEEAET